MILDELNKSKFVIYISDAGEKAEEQVNEFKQQGLNDSTFILPRGIDCQVCGLIHNDERPDLVVVDSFGDIENVVKRLRRQDWVLRYLLKVDSRFQEKKCKFIFADTEFFWEYIQPHLKDSHNWEVTENNEVYV